jgi:two-component system response regulator FixJ
MSGSRVVAVIDDDPAVLDSLAFLLETIGHPVAAYNSASAFLDDRQIDPACLIVDQHMPRMTGLELAARLRAEGTTIPVLLITGLSTPAILERAAQVGIAVLEKPVNEVDLLSFINAHL